MARRAEVFQYRFAWIRGRSSSGRGGGRSGVLWAVVFCEVVQERAGLLVVQIGTVALHPVDNSLPLVSGDLLRGDEVGTVTTGAETLNQGLSSGFPYIVLT